LPVYTSSFKNRQPTNHNIFDSEFNSINENGEWTFKSLTATTITSTNLIYGEDIDVEDKITSIETTIASHTDDIALNSANVLTKQDLITSSTDLECSSLTASSAVVDTITSGNFRATNILTNESDVFPNSDNIILNKTIATGIICGGGTLLLNLSISGFSATSDADTTLTFCLKDSSFITQATIVLIHRFDNTNNIRSMSITQSFIGVPAGTMTLDL